MRKILLSFLIIITFTAYSIHQRLKGTEETPAIIPKNPEVNQTNHSINNPNPIIVNSKYKEGEYIGDIVDAYYGNVQVKVTIGNGTITNVQFLDYPHDRRTSIVINMQAMPYLKQEVIQAQNAQVDIITGATQTSKAFIQSLDSALNKAKG